MKKRFVIIAVAGTVAIGTFLIPTASHADVISDAAASCATNHSPICDTLFGPGGASLPASARDELAAAILREAGAFTGANPQDQLLKDVFDRVAQSFQDPNNPVDALIRDALRNAFVQACAAGGACTVSF